MSETEASGVAAQSQQIEYHSLLVQILNRFLGPAAETFLTLEAKRYGKELRDLTRGDIPGFVQQIEKKLSHRLGETELKALISELRCLFIEAEPERGADVEGVDLPLGVSFLFEEQTGHESYEFFKGLVAYIPGLCITTTFPSKRRNLHQLAKTPMVWLSDTTYEEENVLKPSRLDFEVSNVLFSFMRERNRSVVIIDDIKYLTIINGFEKTVGFLKSVIDIAAASNCIIVASINPQLFTDSEIAILENMFDEIRESRARFEVSPTCEPEWGCSFMIQENKPRRTYVTFNMSTESGRGLCISAHYPPKLRKLYKLKEEIPIYWLTDVTTDEKSLDPRRLEFEVAETIADFAGKYENSVITIDGLVEFTKYYSFNKVTEFIKNVVDLLAIRNSMFLVPVHPGMFTPEELGVLVSRFDRVIRPPEEGSNHAQSL